MWLTTFHGKDSTGIPVSVCKKEWRKESQPELAEMSQFESNPQTEQHAEAE